MTADGTLIVHLVDADDEDAVEDLVAAIERHPAASTVQWLAPPTERPDVRTLVDRVAALHDKQPGADWSGRRRRRDVD